MEDRFGQVDKHISSTEKASSVIGFRMAVSFYEGLKKTIEWYKNNRIIWEKQISRRKVPVKASVGSIIWY
ncbi:MAG: hypothetical protein WC855_04835 [Thermodesulfovibrionales bacterium]